LSRISCLFRSSSTFISGNRNENGNEEANRQETKARNRKQRAHGRCALNKKKHYTRAYNLFLNLFCLILYIEYFILKIIFLGKIIKLNNFKDLIFFSTE